MTSPTEPTGVSDTTQIPKRGFLTIGVGARYRQLATNLARSLKYHNPETPIAVVTDEDLGEDHRIFDFCIAARHDFGPNLMQKMYLDIYSPFEETIFIDADALVVGTADYLWDLFKSLPFGAVGRQAREGYWLTDIKNLLSRIDRPSLPVFNGGLYYFDRSDGADAVFRTARDVMARYDEWGFERIGGGKRDDEAAYAVAMALHGIDAVEDHGTVMRSTLGIWGPLEINVIKGYCRFYKSTAGRVVRPLVVHTLWPAYESYVYKRECLKLSALSRTNLSPGLVSWLIDTALNPLYSSYLACFRALLRAGGTKHPVFPLPLWSTGAPPPDWIPEPPGVGPPLLRRALGDVLRRIGLLPRSRNFPVS